MSESTDRGTSFPLTDLQQAYWLGRHDPFQLADAGTSYYVEVDVVDLDLDRYTLAWRDLVDGHEALRTVVTGTGRQEVLATVPELTIPVLDLRANSDQARLERLNAVRAELLDRRFEPDQWPLFEVRASLVDDRRTRLHILIDLLVCDADSRTVLGSELERRYRVAPGTAGPAPAFREFVPQPKQVQVDVAAPVRDHWRERVLTLPPAPQPPLAQDPGQVQRPRVSRRQRRLPVTQWERVRERADRIGVTSIGALLSAFGEVLGAWSAQHRYTLTVAVRLAHPGRRRPRWWATSPSSPWWR